MTATSEMKAFTPGLVAADPLANYWLRQVMLRLRREICWMWQERTGRAPEGVLPPFTERVSESLDRARYWDDKQVFFESDTTARYLSEQISAAPPHRTSAPERGSFAWVVEQAELDPVSTFILSLALMASFDSASGAVIAACHNDANRTSPTLALAQKLWDTPEEVLALSDTSHFLFRLGLLRRLETASQPTEWDAPLHTREDFYFLMRPFQRNFFVSPEIVSARLPWRMLPGPTLRDYGCRRWKCVLFQCSRPRERLSRTYWRRLRKNQGAPS